MGIGIAQQLECDLHDLPRFLQVSDVTCCGGFRHGGERYHGVKVQRLFLDSCDFPCQTLEPSLTSFCEVRQHLTVGFIRCHIQW